MTVLCESYTEWIFLRLNPHMLDRKHSTQPVVGFSISWQVHTFMFKDKVGNPKTTPQNPLIPTVFEGSSGTGFSEAV